MPLTFITGPVRSGKSRLAELLASRATGPVTFVATADPRPHDAEMRERIATHVARRPAAWRVVETATETDIREVLDGASADETLIVDSLGTWLALCMTALYDGMDDARAVVEAVQPVFDDVTDRLLGSRARVILVCEETGWGVVPTYPSGRAFRDLLGRAQQRLVGGAEAAYLVVAGRAIDLLAVGAPLDDLAAHV